MYPICSHMQVISFFNYLTYSVFAIYVVYFISKSSETWSMKLFWCRYKWLIYIIIIQAKIKYYLFYFFVNSINFSSKFLKLPPNKRPLMFCATMGLNEKILPASLPSLNDRMTLLWQLCAEQWSNRPVLSKSHLSDKMRSNCFFVLYSYTLNLHLYNNYSVINTIHQELLESTKTSDNNNHDCTLQSIRTYKHHRSGLFL